MTTHNEAIEREIEEFREKFGDSAPRIAMRSFQDCDEAEAWLRTSYSRLLTILESKDAQIEAAHHKGFQLGWKDGYQEGAEAARKEERERIVEWCMEQEMGKTKYFDLIFQLTTTPWTNTP